MASANQASPEVTNATAAAGDPSVEEADETPEVQASRISAAINRARGALDEIKAKVKDYDQQYKASETASAHLGGVIAKAQAAFDDLATTASTLKDKTVEIPTKALSRTLAAANSSLEKIGEVAANYDEKFKLSSTVQKAVSVPREMCSSALSEVSNRAASLSATAHAQLQGVNDGIRARAASGAMSIVSGGIGMILSTAAALEGRYAIEEKASDAGTKVKDKALEIDEKYNVKEKAGALATGVLTRAEALDSRVTGGKLTGVALTAYEKGFSMASDGLAYVQGGYEAAKVQRASLSEASGVKDVTPAAAAAVDGDATKVVDEPPKASEGIDSKEATVEAAATNAGDAAKKADEPLKA